jgi:hypothetical protein
MFDKPPLALLIAEARNALDAGAAPGFAQKVVANALGIAQRQLEAGPALAEQEHARLTKLLHAEGDLPALNASLSKAIREGALPVGDPGLLAHLIYTTIAKLEIDQPAYPAFRAWLAR